MGVQPTGLHGVVGRGRIVRTVPRCATTSAFAAVAGLPRGRADSRRFSPAKLNTPLPTHPLSATPSEGLLSGLAGGAPAATGQAAAAGWALGAATGCAGQCEAGARLQRGVGVGAAAVVRLRARGSSQRSRASPREQCAESPRDCPRTASGTVCLVPWRPWLASLPCSTAHTPAPSSYLFVWQLTAWPIQGARTCRALAQPGGARQELAVLVLFRVLVGGEEEEVLREVRQPGQPRRVAQPARAHLPGHAYLRACGVEGRLYRAGAAARQDHALRPRPVSWI